MIFASRFAAVALAALMCWAVPASAQQAPPRKFRRRSVTRPIYLRADELVNAGHKFFGNVSRGLASVIERASANGACRTVTCSARKARVPLSRLEIRRRHALHKNAGDLRVYWQGPSVGFGWGGDGARTMTLVYNCPPQRDLPALRRRRGSAYIVGGFGMTALTAKNSCCGDPLRHRASVRGNVAI